MRARACVYARARVLYILKLVCVQGSVLSLYLSHRGANHAGDLKLASQSTSNYRASGRTSEEANRTVTEMPRLSPVLSGNHVICEKQLAYPLVSIVCYFKATYFVSAISRRLVIWDALTMYDIRTEVKVQSRSINSHFA